MAVFIVTYDKKADRNYQPFYDAMQEHDGVSLAESVWGITLQNTVSQVRDWVHGLMDDDDKIIVVQVSPEPSWATRQATKAANDWLRSNCQSA